MGNIVWLASYPKSGNTWVRAFLHNVLSDTAAPQDINDLRRYCEDESKPYWYEPYAKGGDIRQWTTEEIVARRARVHTDIASSHIGSVFVKTHNFMGAFCGYPLHNMAVTAGAIYIVRNPLDVAISAADHFGMNIDEAIDFMSEDVTGTPTDEANVTSVISSWSQHVGSWTMERQPTLLVIRYEDMLDNPQKTFGSIMKFIKLPKDTKRLKKAIRFSSFGQLKKQERQAGFIERSPNSKRFFREGRKNQWRTLLGKEQIERLIDAHREQMLRFKYVPANYK